MRKKKIRKINVRYILRTQSIIVNSDIFRHIHVLFRHIQSYCCIFRTLCVCVCVCLCVCVCVYVCVSLYPSTVKVSFVCKISEIYLRGTDQRFYVMSIIPGASAKLLHLHIWKCHISPSKRKLQHADKLERNSMIYLACEKMVFIDIGYKSASIQRRRVTKRH